jgi:type IV secretion system protein VirD4
MGHLELLAMQNHRNSNLIHEYKRSIVITDPKGEMCELTSELKRQQGYEVQIINFKEMAKGGGYNPLDYINKEIEVEQVATIIVLKPQTGNKSDFCSKAEIALLKTLLLYVKYECPEGAIMAKVKEILTFQGRTPEKMDPFFDQLEVNHPAYQAYLIVRMTEDRIRASIFISLGITLSKFDSRDVRQFMVKSSSNLEDIGKKKMILYCILPGTFRKCFNAFMMLLIKILTVYQEKNEFISR